jgi:hypothetical protein
MTVPAGFNGAAFEADHGVLCWIADGKLHTSSVVEDLEQKIADNAAKYGVAAVRQARHDAFVAEADPLFFAWQRGEATEEDWLTKCAEIRARFPYVEVEP